MKLCTDCKHYVAGKTEYEDECHHDYAKGGGVRSIRFYQAHAMRAGICGSEARLHDPINPLAKQVQP